VQDPEVVEPVDDQAAAALLEQLVLGRLPRVEQQVRRYGVTAEAPAVRDGMPGRYAAGQVGATTVRDDAGQHAPLDERCPASDVALGIEAAEQAARVGGVVGQGEQLADDLLPHPSAHRRTAGRIVVRAERPEAVRRDQAVDSLRLQQHPAGSAVRLSDRKRTQR
jgi:hypothetical protein